MYDVEGNEYIDYIGSWGPLILGHAHPEAVCCAGSLPLKGLALVRLLRLKSKWLSLFVKWYPLWKWYAWSIQELKLVMSAIRVARGYTGKNKIIKFEGCYQAIVVFVCWLRRFGASAYKVPSSLGVPVSKNMDTLTATYKQC